MKKRKGTLDGSPMSLPLLSLNKLFKSLFFLYKATTVPGNIWDTNGGSNPSYRVGGWWKILNFMEKLKLGNSQIVTKMVIWYQGTQPSPHSTPR